MCRHRCRHGPHPEVVLRGFIKPARDALRVIHFVSLPPQLALPHDPLPSRCPTS